MPHITKTICCFAVLIALLQAVLSIPVKYDTKVWEGEGDTLKVQGASKEYARNEKKHASAAEVGNTKAQGDNIEQYPAAVMNYPGVVNVPMPVPSYTKKTFSLHPKGIYGQEVGQYGQELGQFDFGSYAPGPYFSRSYIPNLGYSLGFAQG
ncbi:hypothetical protein L9F63_019275 [Diploptera punctata]|uniref:Uncharacterized protein n=1 Tax=Diploptera punctata TaxID=6984 RepID=A0AAD7ZUJ4_DIPPU|nr:hypothetical protein L9F63_019275 [Diploptera punctata]